MANYKIQNNVYTTLTNSISNSDDTITINKANDPFNSPPDLSSGETGVLTIVDSTKDPTKIEIINYSNWVDNGDGTINVSGCTRGQDGTTAYSFANGAVIMQSITNDILNNILESSEASVNNLSDVDASSISDNDFLVYNASTETWEPSAIGFDNLSDVDLSSLTDQHFVRYNSTSGNWEVVSLGNAAYRDYYISTSEPTSEDGEDGDVWYQIS